jgi:hypothetical protein
MRYYNYHTFAALLFASCWAKSTDFSSDQTKPKGNLRGLDFVSRILVRFGPPPGESHVEGEPLKGCGYGMAAIEGAAYDPVNHY